MSNILENDSDKEDYEEKEKYLKESRKRITSKRV